MLLALDVGNTNITLGVYEGEKLLFVTRMATNPPRMEDEYASAMLSILHLYNIHTSQVNGAVLSSVVPRLPARCAVFGRWNRSSSARSLCRS